MYLTVPNKALYKLFEVLVARCTKLLRLQPPKKSLVIPLFNLPRTNLQRTDCYFYSLPALLLVSHYTREAPKEVVKNSLIANICHSHTRDWGVLNSGSYVQPWAAYSSLESHRVPLPRPGRGYKGKVWLLEPREGCVSRGCWTALTSRANRANVENRSWKEVGK